jgi:hypothetical protein
MSLVLVGTSHNLSPVEDREQLALLVPRREAGFRRPIDVADGGDPDGAELTIDRRRLRRGRARHEQGHEHEHEQV